MPHHLALVIKLNPALGDKMIEKPVNIKNYLLRIVYLTMLS
jgi:hypothetical protein